VSHFCISLFPPACCSPEGLIIAVPVYAATNSKAKAIALAAASGLSEPIGALFALFVLRPFVVSLERLDYVLAAVGGVMLGVCGLELWPEARKCKQDVRMVQGMLLGTLAMGWTLLVGV
jgi:ZIP family zinc transporter